MPLFEMPKNDGLLTETLGSQPVSRLQWGDSLLNRRIMFEMSVTLRGSAFLESIM
jgi:hypothetical protein